MDIILDMDKDFVHIEKTTRFIILKSKYDLRSESTDDSINFFDEGKNRSKIGNPKFVSQQSFLYEYLDFQFLYS